METLINIIKQEIEENKLRENDIPIARKSYDDLAFHSKEIQKRVLASKLWPAKAAQASAILKGSLEINGGILASVENNYLSASEALLRISIEHSINIIYIFNDLEITRSRSYLKHAIVDMEEKAKKQQNRAKRENDLLDVFSSNNNMDFAKTLKSENPKLFKDKELRWHNAYDRFKDCGFEKEYRNLFSTASDAVHSLSQDVLNLIFSLNMPAPLNRLSLEKNETYRKSLSIYFLLQALRLNAIAVKKVAEAVEYECVDDINRVHDRVLGTILEHEHELAERQLTNQSTRTQQSCAGV